MFKKPVGFRGEQAVVRSTLPAQQPWNSQRGAATGRVLGGLAAAVGGGFVGKACYDVNVRPRVQGNISADKAVVMNDVIPATLGAASAEVIYLVVLGLFALARKTPQKVPQERIVTAQVTPLPLMNIPEQQVSQQSVQSPQPGQPVLVNQEVTPVSQPVQVISSPSIQVLRGAPLLEALRPAGQKKLAPIKEWVRSKVSQIVAEEAASIPPSIGSHPTIIGPYKIIRFIGGGGMKNVYLAQDNEQDRLVTIHVPKRMDDPKVRARFVQEVETLWRVFHSNIMDIYYAKLEGNQPYFVGEYIEGVSLKNFIKKERFLPLSKALAIYYWTLMGLKEAHVAGVIHRDLKPDNIMLANDGTVKIIDFGLGKVMHTEQELRDLAAQGQREVTTFGALMGTPTYWPPDNILLPGGSKDVDYRADIYTLGLILYTMLTGQPPRRFPGDAVEQQILQFISYATNPHVPVFPQLDSLPVPVDIKDLLRLTTNKEPDYRLVEYDAIEEMVLRNLVIDF